MAQVLPKILLLAAALAAAAIAQELTPVFSLSTDLEDAALPLGVPRNFSVVVANVRAEPLAVRVAVEGRAASLAGPPLSLTLAPRERREVSLALSSPTAGVYPGTLTVEGGGERREVSFEIRVLASLLGAPADLEVVPGSARPGERVTISVVPRAPPPLRGALLVRTEAGEVVFQENLDLREPVNLSFTIPPGTAAGELRVEAALEGHGSRFRSLTVLPAPFPTYLLLLPAAAVAAVVLTRWRSDILAILAGRRRYPPLSAYSDLPRGPLRMGRVAGTRRALQLHPDHLRGHILLTGATGGGKSVAAMVLAEEVLQLGWAVVVCDPTAQWTGLLRPCRDRTLLRRYRAFGLREAKGWPGTRRDVPRWEVSDVAPGKLLLFDFPENYEDRLAGLLGSLLAAGRWDVPVLLVLEEVHRALPKYGAPPHLYPLLEKAVRELRERGVALVMTSQLLADFSEEMRNSVLAEVQTLTKGPEELERMRKKHGAEPARLATRLEPGVGLLHHPEVNGGRPVAVAFRPPLGDPHKLPGPVLDRWRDLWRRHWTLSERVADGEARKSLAMARERLEGFRLEMAQFYLDEVQKTAPAKNVRP